MPSFTKFDSTVGSRMSRLKSPRSVGPSQRAVIMPVSMPMIVITTWPPRTRITSRTNFGGPFRSSGTRRLRRDVVERVAAALDHRRAEPRDGRAPERRHLPLERIGGRVEPLHVDGDVRRADAVERVEHFGGCVDGPEIDHA